MHFITHFGRNDKILVDRTPIAPSIKPEQSSKIIRDPEDFGRQPNIEGVMESKSSYKCFLGELLIEVILMPIQQIRADKAYLAGVLNILKNHFYKWFYIMILALFFVSKTSPCKARFAP